MVEIHQIRIEDIVLTSSSGEIAHHQRTKKEAITEGKRVKKNNLQESFPRFNMVEIRHYLCQNVELDRVEDR